MKQKNILLIGIAVVVVLFAGGGIFLMSRGSKPATVATPTPPEQEQVLTMKAEDIGLSVTNKTYVKKNSSGPGLHLEATKLAGVSNISCEIQYTHTNSAGEEQDEGMVCSIDIKSGMDKISQDFAFGTCSDVCHFHTNINHIKGTIKVTKDGKIYAIDVTVPNPQ